MKRLTHVMLLLACAAVIAQCFVLWAATGRAGFTRYKDPTRIDKPSSEPSLSDLFADTGLEDETGVMPQVPNEFRLGLLPSGFDKHIVSVFTLAGPAGIAALILVIGALPSLRSKVGQGVAEK